MNLKFSSIITTVILFSAGVLVATNPQLLTKQFYVLENKDNAACNVPLSHLLPSTINIIQSNPKGVCLGGLTLANGAPILGDLNSQPILLPSNKYPDLQANIVNNVLICQVSCSNPYAKEIRTCNDLQIQPSFSIRAYNPC